MRDTKRRFPAALFCVVFRTSVAVDQHRNWSDGSGIGLVERDDATEEPGMVLRNLIDSGVVPVVRLPML